MISYFDLSAYEKWVYSNYPEAVSAKGEIDLDKLPDEIRANLEAERFREPIGQPEGEEPSEEYLTREAVETLRVNSNKGTGELTGPEEARERAYEKVLHKYREWGLSRTALNIIAKAEAGRRGMTEISPPEAETFIREHIEERWGAPITEPGEEGERKDVPAWLQKRMPSALQLRKATSISLGKDAALMHPKDVPEGYIRRSQAKSAFPAETLIRTWPGIPGKEPGTIATEQDIDTAEGLLKQVKDWQRAGVYEQPNRVLTQRGANIGHRYPVRRSDIKIPTKEGKKPLTKDPVFSMRTVSLLEEWLPEGAMYVPEGHIKAVESERPKRIRLPEGFKVEDLQEGRVWKAGEPVIPFKGAAPVDLKLGKGYDRARLERAEVIETDEGRELELQFMRRSSLQSGAWAFKSFTGRYMGHETQTERVIPSLGGEPFAISEIKRQSFLAHQWFGEQPKEVWAEALADERGLEGTDKKQFIESFEYDDVTWETAGRELANWFAKEKVGKTVKEGGLYMERDMFLPMSWERFSNLRGRDDLKGRIKKHQILGPKHVLAKIENVPMLDLGTISHQMRKENIVNIPRLGERDLERLKEVSPEIYERVVQEGAGQRAPYAHLVGAHQMSAQASPEIRASSVGLESGEILVNELERGPSYATLVGDMIHKAVQDILKKEFPGRYETEKEMRSRISGVDVTGHMDLYDKWDDRIIEIKSTVHGTRFADKYEEQSRLYGMMRGARKASVMLPGESLASDIKTLRGGFKKRDIPLDTKGLDQLPGDLYAEVYGIAESMVAPLMPDRTKAEPGSEFIEVGMGKADMARTRQIVAQTAQRQMAVRALIESSGIDESIISSKPNYPSQIQAAKEQIGGKLKNLPDIPGRFVMTGKSSVITPSRDDILNVVDRATRKVGEDPNRPKLIHQILKEASEEWGTHALKIAPDAIMMAPQYVSEHFGHEEVLGYETSEIGRKYARTLMAISGTMGLTPNRIEGDPGDDVYTTARKYMQAQGRIATGEESKKFRASAATRRMYGAVAYAEPLLEAGEIMLPKEEVFKRYNITGEEERAKFEDAWKKGLIKVGALAWGQPIPDADIFSKMLRVVHPDVIRERAGDKAAYLRENAPFAVSEDLAEGFGRDFDADLLWSLLTGDYEGGAMKYGHKLGFASEKDVEGWRKTRWRHGRPVLERGKGIKPPPGWEGTEEEWGELPGQEKAREWMLPANLKDVDQETLRKISSLGHIMGGNITIGTYANLSKYVKSVAETVDEDMGTGEATRKAATALGEHVYGRAQGPSFQVPGVAEAMQFLWSTTQRGARSMTPMEKLEAGFPRRDEEEWKSGAVDRTAGTIGIMRGIVGSLAGAKLSDIPPGEEEEAEKEWVEIVARTAFPADEYEKAKAFIEKYRLSETDQEMQQKMLQSTLRDPYKWMEKTVMGRASLGAIVDRWGGTRYVAQNLGEFRPELVHMADEMRRRYAQSRAYFTSWENPEDRPNIPKNLAGSGTSERWVSVNPRQQEELTREHANQGLEPPSGGMYSKSLQRGMFEEWKSRSQESLQEIYEKREEWLSSRMRRATREGAEGETVLGEDVNAELEPINEFTARLVSQMAGWTMEEARGELRGLSAEELQGRSQAIVESARKQAGGGGYTAGFGAGGISRSSFEESLGRLGATEEMFQTLRGQGFESMTPGEGKVLRRTLKDINIARAGMGMEHMPADLVGQAEGVLQKYGAWGREGMEMTPERMTELFEKSFRAEGVPEEVRQVGLKGFAENVELATQKLGEFAPQVDDITQRLEKGKQLGQQQEQLLMKTLKPLADRVQAAPRGMVPTETQQMASRVQANIGKQQILQAAAGGGAGQMYGGAGGGMWAGVPGGEQIGGAADKAFNWLAGYWNMFRMRRIWGMTGGYAMGAVGPAAQHQQRLMQAAYVARGGTGTPRVGGMMSGLLNAQEEKARGYRAMGTATYQAYGGIGGASEALGTIGGIGLPALGIGGIVGLGASGIGSGLTALGVGGLAGISATGVGLPVAGAVAAYGLTRYARSQLDPGEARNQLRYYRTYQQAREPGPGFFSDAPFMEKASPVIGFAKKGIGDFLAPALRPAEYTEWMREQPIAQRALMHAAPNTAGFLGGVMFRQGEFGEPGMDIAETPISELDIPAATAKMQERARELAGEGGALAPFKEEDVADMMAELMAYSGIKSLEGVGDKEVDLMEYMLMTGGSPSQFGKMARQLRMGDADWEKLARWRQDYGPQQFEKALGIYEQYKPMTRWEEPEEIMKSALEERIAPLAMPQEQALRQYGQLAGQGAQYSISMPSWEAAGRPGEYIVGRMGAAMSVPMQMQQQWGVPAPAMMGVMPQTISPMAERTYNQFLSGNVTLPRLQEVSDMLGMPGLMQPNLVTQGPAGMNIGTIAPVGFGMGMDQFKAGYGQAQRRLELGRQTGDFVGPVSLPAGGVAGAASYQNVRWPKGSMWRIQQDMTDLSTDYARTQADAQMANIRAQREYYQTIWPMQEQQQQLGYVQQMGGVSEFGGNQYTGAFAFQQQQAQMGLGYTMANIGFSRQGLALSREQQAIQQRGQAQDYQWQMENLGIQYGRGLIQRGWTREDWGRQQGRMGREFGWQMEDYEESIRFASGRQREQLIERQERDVIRYADQRGDFEREKERQEERWQWQDEDHERQMEHLAIRRERQKELDDIAQRRLDIQEQRLNKQEQHARESHALQMKQLEERKQGYQESFKIQEEIRQVTQDYQMESLDRAEAAAGAAAAHAEAMRELQEEYTNTQRKQQILLSEWSTQMGKALIKALKAISPEAAGIFAGYLASAYGADSQFTQHPDIE